ncbi:MAG: glutamate-cysteine ligase family protein [Candidatus Marsarchaeota archaeon]|nr:glutamate-cysteine ligase family protein [Candidatus Marsarchaeota archaeon]MCL5413303.1 glutamate-cysteine ligase family protein [Candidatus Marsarchaeota archaeon]
MPTKNTELSKWHPGRFEANPRESRKLGIELEFPLVSAKSGSVGEAIDLKTAREIYGSIAMDDKSWGLNLKELEVSKICNDGQKVTLNSEAGFSTLELSLPPAQGIDDARTLIATYAPVIIHAAESAGAYVLGYGIQPITPPNAGLISTKDRSRSMLHIEPIFDETRQEEHDWRLSGTVSSSVQFHITALGPEDAMRLMTVFNGLSPEFLLLSANSRVAKGKDSGRSDTRSRFYQLYDRIPLVAGVAPRFSNFNEYIEALIDIPVHLLSRSGKYVVSRERKSFRDFMNSGTIRTIRHENPDVIRIEEFQKEDVDVHESMIRWEARVKGTTGTVEFRTCSMQQSAQHILALASAVVGLASNLDEAEALATSRSVEDAQKAKELISLFGAHGSKEALNSTKRMLDIAKEGLEKTGENTNYLELLYRAIRRKEVPSDRSLKVLNEGMGQFIQYVRFDPNIS